ncbi:MAG: hypothetical protein K9I94_01505 [Bacteroidales bacterium]|nr:hypothetical protein [Bacteroidales bacterium]
MRKKRLDLLEKLIREGDHNELELEVKALEQSEKISASNKKLISKLRNCCAEEALETVDHLRNTVELPELSSNVDLQGLRTESSLLETRLSVLFIKHAEISHLISQFRLRYHQEVGPIMSKILELRQELLFLEKDESPEKAEEYEEAKDDKEKFDQSSTNIQKEKRNQLPEEKRRKLQQMFRKASKLCHPDIVSEELEEHAAELFAQLNDAYFSNDLETVEEILKQLESENFQFGHKSQSISQKQKLEANVQKLRSEVDQLQKEIEQLKLTEVYRTIQSLEDWDRYFERLKKEFEKQLTRLENEYQEK